MNPDVHLARTERLEMAGLVAGQIAHDFNNLLTPLLAYPDLIRNEVKQNAVVEEYLSIIEKTATEMQHLTLKLLTLARRGRVSRAVFGISDVIGEVVQALQASLPQGVTVKCDLAGTPHNIAGSRSQIHAALENLFQNAVDAMGTSGTLTIQAEDVYLDAPFGEYQTVTRGEYVKISVRDTGAGIPEDIRGKIFDPFFTTKRATKRRGSGLGLSIVHGIVNDHQGYVDFESTLGKGSTFFVYLPVAKDFSQERIAPTLPKEPERVPVVAADSPPAEKPLAPRILIADDEQMIRKLFGMILMFEFPEAVIDQVSDGELAVEAFSKSCHDLIIMDLQMPGQDGRESFFEIQKICTSRNWRLPPIVFCTGFTPSESLADIIKDSSVNCLLRKPIKAELLLEAVRKRLPK
jgi:two-component system cell cycle sensor histidine kinase/response regulator CckA